MFKLVSTLANLLKSAKNTYDFLLYDDKLRISHKIPLLTNYFWPSCLQPEHLCWQKISFNKNIFNKIPVQPGQHRVQYFELCLGDVYVFQGETRQSACPDQNPVNVQVINSHKTQQTNVTFDLARVINSLITDSVSLQSEKNWNASVAASRVCFFFAT